MRTARPAGLSAAERQLFEDRGLVKLEGFIPRDDAEALADRLWEALERLHGIRRGEPATWRQERPAGFGATQKAGAFSSMATPEFRTLLDDMLGEDRWIEPTSWGQPLVCFPQAQSAWDIPHRVWHFDLTPDPRRPALVGRLFVLLAPLRAKGGGTLVATGSHRIAAALAERREAHLSSQEMRKRLAAEYAWFADLMSPARDGQDRRTRFMGAETIVDGVPLRVEELTGEPGDLFLMHPNALHGLSSNALETPRLTLAQTVYPKS